MVGIHSNEESENASGEKSIFYKKKKKRGYNTQQNIEKPLPQLSE